MIAPTIGRVVWFYKFSPGHGHKGPLAAHVCKVYSNTSVNLMVIDESGNPYGALSVHLQQSDNEENPAADFCCWMPFQKGQAAKTEALEKQLK